MNYELIHIIWTVILVSIFVGIIIWALSKSNTSRFETAANLPFVGEGEDEVAGETRDDGKETNNSSDAASSRVSGNDAELKNE